MHEPRPKSKAPGRAALALALFAPLLVLVAGCTLWGSSPKSDFFSLETVPGSEREGTRPVTGLPLAVERVRLPSAVDRRALVVYRTENRLDILGTQRWAGPLEEMVEHTLAFDLADRLGETMVVLPGHPKPEGGRRMLSILFEELAAGPEPVLVLDAHWTLQNTEPISDEKSSGGTGRQTETEIARHTRIEEPISSLDGSEIAAGTSRALAKLADSVAAEMRESR